MKKQIVLISFLLVNLLSTGCGSDSSGSAGSSNLIGGAVQGTPLSLDNVVTTVAGTPDIIGAADNDNGALATFSVPEGITTDGTSLFVCDSQNQLIRKIRIGTGAVSTLAGTEGITGSTDNATGPGGATFTNPHFLTTDGTNLYLTEPDSNIIRKVVISTGAVTRFAGTGDAASIDNTDRLQASFNNPRGITTDGTNLYVTDSLGNKIRKIAIATGVVTTLAGSGAPGADDNTVDGLSATFNAPWGVTTDGSNLYVADRMNERIRKVVIATGAVTTLAGGVQGFQDGTGAAAMFCRPSSLTTDGTSIFLADQRNSLIRKIAIATGVVTTIAGNGTDGSLDGIGTAAGFNRPIGITTDGRDLYVTDGNQTIRKID